MAGLNILDFKQTWSSGFKQSVWNSRVKTTQQLAKAVVNSDAKAFVTISGVAYYPPDGKEYTENDECEKYDFLSGNFLLMFIFFLIKMKPNQYLCFSYFRVMP